jgi:hypothetical protein
MLVLLVPALVPVPANNVLPRSAVPRLVHTNNLPNFLEEWSIFTHFTT